MFTNQNNISKSFIQTYVQTLQYKTHQTQQLKFNQQFFNVKNFLETIVFQKIISATVINLNNNINQPQSMLIVWSKNSTSNHNQNSDSLSSSFKCIYNQINQQNLNNLPEIKQVIVDFKILKIQDSQFYNYLKLKQRNLQISFITLNEKHFVIGTNYGILIAFPAYHINNRIIHQNTKKVLKFHTNKINYITFRGQYGLTCSDDATALIFRVDDYERLHLLKDQFHIKQKIYKGQFIDDYKVAICSRSFIKVYCYQYTQYHIMQALMTFQMEYINNIYFVGQLAFVNHQSNHLKIYLMDRVSNNKKYPKFKQFKPSYSLSSKNLKQTSFSTLSPLIKLKQYTQVFNFCMSENNLAIIKQTQSYFALIQLQGHIGWRLHKRYIKGFDKIQIISDQMYCSGGFLYVYYEQTKKLIRFKLPNVK